MMRAVRVLIAAVLFAAAGCGVGQSAAGTSGGSDLSITSPADGASVTLPFTVQLRSAEPLAAPETGLHHVHIYFDGDDSKYLLVYGQSIDVTAFPTDLPPGRHTMVASLRNADHSAAGTETQIAVDVGSGNGAPPAQGGSNGY